MRGSIPCPGQDWIRYGGNTPCVEVRCGNHLLILDAGTGLHRLGSELKAPFHAHVLFTHTHVDHICGFPFFEPLFDARNRVECWAGHLENGKTLHQALSDYMAAPLFPVPPAIFEAKIRYHDFKAGDVLRPWRGVTVRTAPLNHPNGATGYRIEYEGRSVCYITDTEHRPGEPDRNILKLIAGADIVIYDSTYTDESFPRHVGWGHSTWQEGVRLCELADAGTLVIFHHEPTHDDAAMDEIAARAEKRRPGTIVAREGLVL